MKTKHLFLAVACALAATACSNEEPVMSTTETQKAVVENAISRSDGNVLTFESQADFQAAVDKIAAIESSEEKLSWVHNHYPDFVSWQDIYEAAGTEAAESDLETEEEYSLFKEKYSSLYFPAVGEDAGFYIPMKNLDEAYLTNQDGLVVIGGQYVNKTDIFDYETLKDLGRAYYYDEPIMLLVDKELTMGSSYDRDPVGPEYDSGWKTYGKRKVKLKLRRLFKKFEVSKGFYGSQSRIHTEFCFRKKTWIGWVNYSCTSNINGTVKIPGLAQPFTFSSHESGVSSHDKEHQYPIRKTVEGNYWYLRFEEAPCTVTVDFKDITNPITFNWTFPGLYFRGPKSSNPPAIVPYF